MSKKVLVIFAVFLISIFGVLRIFKNKSLDMSKSQANKTLKVTSAPKEEKSAESKEKHISKKVNSEDSSRIENEKDKSMKSTVESGVGDFFKSLSSSSRLEDETIFNDVYPTVGLSEAEILRIEAINESVREHVREVNHANKTYKELRKKFEQKEVK